MRRMRNGFEVEQRNTRGAWFEKIGLSIAVPPQESLQPATKEDAEKVVRSAQQIAFLPNFYPTDHIFYGEVVNSDDEKDGFASVRTAMIESENFDLYIDVNFNYKWTSVTLYALKGIIDRRSIIVANGETDAATARFLIDQVLIPVRDELMMQR